MGGDLLKRYLYFMMFDDIVDREFFGYQFDEMISPTEVMVLMAKCKCTRGCFVIDTKGSTDDSQWEKVSYFTQPI